MYWSELLDSSLPTARSFFLNQTFLLPKNLWNRKLLNNFININRTFLSWSLLEVSFNARFMCDDMKVQIWSDQKIWRSLWNWTKQNQKCIFAIAGSRKNIDTSDVFCGFWIQRVELEVIFLPYYCFYTDFFYLKAAEFKLLVGKKLRKVQRSYLSSRKVVQNNLPEDTLELLLFKFIFFQHFHPGIKMLPLISRGWNSSPE